MNRQQRRNLAARLSKKGYSSADIVSYIRAKEMQELAGCFQEGDRVQLNMEAITGDPNWPGKTEAYQRFCLDNAHHIFTVEFDVRHKEKPSLVCLAEDTTEPKWLFFVGDLKTVDDELQNDDYPCTDHECYNRGNYHTSCVECTSHK